MPPNVKPSKQDLDSDAVMKLEPRQSSFLQQNSKPVKESVPSRQENQNSKYRGKLKVETSVGPPFSDYPHELRREADKKLLVQLKSSGNHQLHRRKGKATKDDELVKYMSKLPGYLKHMDGGQNHQDKVLNVGVLDWSRLEEWKNNQKYAVASGSNNTSATSSSLVLKNHIRPSHGRMHAHQSEQQLSVCPSPNSSKKGGVSRGVKPSSQRALRFEDIETSLKSNLGGQSKTPWTNKSFDRNNADLTTRKGKTKECDQKIASEMGNLSADLEKNRATLSPKVKVTSWNGEVEKPEEEFQVSNKIKKDLDKKIFSAIGATYPKSRSHGISHGSKEKINSGNVQTKRTDKLQESNIDLGHHHLPGELNNIVLLRPKVFSQNSSRWESGSAQYENFVEANQNCVSGGSFLPVKSCSAELSSDIPQLLSLRSEGESKIKSNMMAHGDTNSKHTELSSAASHSSPYSSTPSVMLSNTKDAEQSSIRHMDATADENLNFLDQEMADMAVARSRNSSPNRRFSFSLSRMGRSLSWKESSAVPQLSSSYFSVKSGPVKSEDVSCLDDSSRQKTGRQTRARSSPLRRILDPLLRSRSSNRGQPTEIVPPLKGNSNHINFRPFVDNASLPNKRHETAQALLQLTMKNGLPLFKFVVDNNSNVLAATVKTLTSGKDDSRLNYTFYSVNEIKKKGGGWISQGSKEKSSGFVYNVVGQMVSRSHFPNLKSQNLKIQYMVRESVLFGVEIKQADQATSNFTPNKELAAIVMETPIGSFSHDAEQRDTDTTEEGFTDCFPWFRSSYSSEGNGYSWSTAVILPSGVHGLPNKGAPSPLIERWKSGGICDCGGWDVGCKLRMLTDSSQITSIACSNSDSFELFEEGVKRNRPIFSLVPLNKEIYSVEFNPSVSLLQAFFISVTVVSRHKLSYLSEVSSLYEAGVCQEEPMMNVNVTKKSSLTTEKMPAKYAPNPPHSPVGRV